MGLFSFNLYPTAVFQMTNFVFLGLMEFKRWYVFSIHYYIYIAVSCERWAVSCEIRQKNRRTCFLVGERWRLCEIVWKTGKWIAAGFQTRGIRIYTYICRLQRRESVVRVAVPRLCRRTFHPCNYFHGFKNPRLFALRASRPSDAFRWRMSDEGG